MGLSGLPANFNLEQHAERIEEAELEDLFYGGIGENRKKTFQQLALEAVQKLNVDQKSAFLEIADSLLGHSQEHLFFIEGSGGCG